MSCASAQTILFVSLRDALINLGPAVKPRGDKIKTLGSRGDKGNACGAMDPGLRRDDDRAVAGVTTDGASG